MRMTTSHKMTVTDDMVTPQIFKKQPIYSNRQINMKQLTLLLATVLLVNLFATGKLLAQNDYYFPDAGSFDPAIPTPEDFWATKSAPITHATIASSPIFRNWQNSPTELATRRSDILWGTARQSC